MFSSSVQNSEGRGDGNSGDSFADPCQFLPFPKTKIQLSASLRPLAKKGPFVIFFRIATIKNTWIWFN